MQFVNLSAKTAVVFVYLFVLSLGASSGTSLQQRQLDAVVISGEKLSALAGEDIGKIRVYRYNAAADLFQPVPFQVDERNYKGEYFGAENGILDSYDELVFMVKDMGDQAASDQVWPDDYESKQHKRYECAIIDPLTNEIGYIYVFISSTLPLSTDTYVQYANEGVTTAVYHVGHNPDVASGLPDTLYVRREAGGDVVDFINKQRLRIWTTADLPTGFDDISLRIYDKCTIKKDIRSTLGKVGELRISVYQDRVEVKTGPVRVIRKNILQVDWSASGGTLGSGNGSFNIPIGFRYYSNFFEVPYTPITLDLKSFLDFLERVQASLKYTSVYYTMMLNNNGKNMRFLTPRLSNPSDRPSGFKIDGLANESYFYNGDLASNEWPGQHWYGVVADAVDPASIVRHATVYTHVTLNRNQPTTGPETIFFMEIPGDDPTVYGDAGVRIYQGSGLPSILSLDVNIKYYIFPVEKNYFELQTFFEAHSDSLQIVSQWQNNDHTPPDNITITVIGRTQNSLTLSWTTVGDDGMGGGPAKEYYIRLHTVPPGNDIWAWWEAAGQVFPTPIPKPPGSIEQFTLTDLEPNRQYYIGIRVLDEAGNASAIAFVTDITTPVELASFTAQSQQAQVLLQWTTLSESNNLGFTVERQMGGTKEWESIAFIRGAGTTHVPKYYKHIDQPNKIGLVSYRLKQIDTDGRFTYYPEVSTQISAPQTWALMQNYPNPFNPTTVISYHVPQGVQDHLELVVYDLLGRQVRTLVHQPAEMGYYQITWDGYDDDGRMTASGIYIYVLRCGRQQLVRKMIKVE